LSGYLSCRMDLAYTTCTWKDRRYGFFHAPRLQGSKHLTLTSKSQLK
jgi:hypothetical protein